MFDNKLEQLANYMIRPRRRQYSQSDLGPKIFKSKYGLCVRQDFQMLNDYTMFNSSGQDYANNKPNKNNKDSIHLKCSVFTSSVTNAKISRKKEHQKHRQTSIGTNSFIPQQSICVLAMHGNTGSRISTLNSLEPVIRSGLAYAIFDFAGCGNSQGDLVTLGYYQKYQIAAVLNYLHHKYGFFKFILYGRSMGAASALFYSSDVYPKYTAHKINKINLQFWNNYHDLAKIDQSSRISKQYYKYFDKRVSKQQYNYADIIKKLNIGYFGYEVIGLILDSPYYDAKQMITDIVRSRSWFVPSFLTNFVLSKVNQKVQKRLSQAFKQNGNKQKGPVHSVGTNNNSIIENTRIPEQSYIPFPVFVIYGLLDDVISKNHTSQLFKRIISEHKKLHILQNQGHGNHRQQAIKIEAIQWILGFQYQRIGSQVQKDARLLRMSVPLFNKLVLENQLENTKNYWNQNGRQKIVQKSTQIQSERTQSLSSIMQFNSMQSLQSNFGNLSSQLQVMALSSSIKIKDNNSIIYKHDYREKETSQMIQKYQENIKTYNSMKQTKKIDTYQQQKSSQLYTDNIMESKLLLKMSGVNPYCRFHKIIVNKQEQSYSNSNIKDCKSLIMNFNK